jgi:hypothetical protein
MTFRIKKVTHFAFLAFSGRFAIHTVHVAFNARFLFNFQKKPLTIGYANVFLINPGIKPITVASNASNWIITDLAWSLAWLTLKGTIQKISRRTYFANIPFLTL